jgi:hypothetical protein
MMRVFVGYGYNERDKWVEDYVVPMLAAFGCEVLHGKAVYGGALPEEVIKLIRTADAMIGFTTRRDPVADGKYRTHDWVVQELTTAHGQDPRVPWVEVREDAVISPGGILEAADPQRINYRAENLAICLVEIARALRGFQDLTLVTMIRLGPASAAEQISGLLDDPTFTCTCQTLAGVVQTQPRRTPVFPIRGGLFVQLRGVNPRDLVRISISARGRIWRSDYDSVDTVDVQVRE